MQSIESDFAKKYLRRFYAEAYEHPAYARRNKGVRDKLFRYWMRIEVADCARRYAWTALGKKEELFICEYSKKDREKLGAMLAQMTFDELRRAVAGDRADRWMQTKGGKHDAD